MADVKYTLWSLPSTEEEAVTFFQEHGVLPTIRKCNKGHDMKLSLKDSGRWYCCKSSCRNRVGLRNGTWFEKSKLPFLVCIRFIYCWCSELTSIKFCEKELKISDKTAIDWNNYMREVVSLDMEKRSNHKIGGSGKIVEVDESLFSKRKNNSGRVLPEQWVFGGICRETNDCFVVLLPDRSAKTLISVIEKYIERGSTIYSDSWGDYKTKDLEEAGWKRLTVNYKYKFIDRNTGAHAQHLDRMWGSAKWRNKKYRGTARHHLKSYIVEFFWRRSLNGEDAFNNAMKAIATHFPPVVVSTDSSQSTVAYPKKSNEDPLRVVCPSEKFVEVKQEMCEDPLRIEPYLEEEDISMKIKQKISEDSLTVEPRVNEEYPVKVKQELNEDLIKVEVCQNEDVSVHINEELSKDSVS